MGRPKKHWHQTNPNSHWQREQQAQCWKTERQITSEQGILWTRKATKFQQVFWNRKTKTLNKFFRPTWEYFQIGASDDERENQQAFRSAHKRETREKEKREENKKITETKHVPLPR